MAARSISAFLDTQTTRYAEILSPVPTGVARVGVALGAGATPTPGRKRWGLNLEGKL